MDTNTISANNLRPASFLTSNVLKYIAIIAMTIDHIAWAFVAEESVLGIVMHTVGRTTGPIMFYAAVEGYHHTRNLRKYLLRLAVFALISWIPFQYFSSGGIIPNIMDIRYMLLRPNVIYTILLGILAIHIRRTMKNPILKAVFILTLIVLCISADWGTWGILIIIVFDYFYGNFKNQAFGYCMVVLLDVGVLSYLTSPFFDLVYNGTFAFSLDAYQIPQLGMFIPIILLSFYNGKKGNGHGYTKWLFYVYYPVHMVILGFLQSILAQNS